MQSQHAVPQDIKSFEFKLVGDMTLKQFGYLAAGAAVAFSFYSTNWYPIIKFPMIILAMSMGVSLAFVPIQERPLETWITNFFKSIYRPTLYHWQKAYNRPVSEIISATNNDVEILPLPPIMEETTAQAKPQTNDEMANQQLKEYLETVNKPPSIEDLLKIREANSQPKIEQAPAASPEPEVEPPPPPIPPQPRAYTLDDLIAKRDPSKVPGPVADDTIGPIDRAKLTFPAPRPSPYLKDHVKVIKKDDLKNQPPASFQITTPNLISGIIRDNQKQTIPGTIVIIKNSEGTSVRALRTNKVGQFIASTPLESGVYYLEMEKEGYKFDVLEIKLDGTIIPPLEIYAA